jgi:serine/threonine protein kinase
LQEKVAIKRIKPMARDEWEARHTLREITIMRLCDRHPNVISLRGLSVNETEEELYIIMELMFSDLYKIIKHVRPLNAGQVKVILKQLLKGLEALHAIGVIHRDLKPVRRGLPDVNYTGHALDSSITSDSQVVKSLTLMAYASCRVTCC